MRIRKKSKSGDESYWKSFTDIMAGLLMVILLVLMLLLLYMTQMNKDTHKYDEKYEYSEPFDPEDNLHDKEDHLADELYDRPPNDGGGGGGGVDDPGNSTTDGINYDVGHDKCAVFVTVVDEETGKAIKKKGILFSLYRGSKAGGSLMTLHTYYPTKVDYKQYETTPEGTFYLPEKIRNDRYTLHNLKAPKGYSFADDVSFQITESRDWNDPYRVTVPMSPSKSVIYVKSVDADTGAAVQNTTYEVYAQEDIVTLDGTVRHKAGDLVDNIKCDSSGKGASTKLYFGKYRVVQKTTAQYYARNTESLIVTLDYLEDKNKVYTIECSKTLVEFGVYDEETKQPVAGAVYVVSGRDDMTTNEQGRFQLTDLEKGSTYTLTLKELPKPYRTKKTEFSFKVDDDGLIGGKPTYVTGAAVYIIRMEISVTDQLFGNEIKNVTLRLYDGSDEKIEEWIASGEKEEFDDLEPGTYTLEVNGDKDSRVSVRLLDKGGIQTLETATWTTLDTLAIIGAALAGILLIVLVIAIARSARRRKKHNEEE